MRRETSAAPIITSAAAVGDEIRMALKGYTGISSQGQGETGVKRTDLSLGVLT